MNSFTSFYERANGYLNWLNSLENKIFNSTPINKLSTKVDDALDAGIEKLYRRSSTATKQALDAPAANNTHLLFSACRTASTAWTWARDYAQESLKSSSVTPDIISRGAVQLAFEKLQIESTKRLSTEQVGQMKGHALRLPIDTLQRELDSIATVAPTANPTTKQVVKEAVKESVHQGAKWGVRWIALMTIPGMLVPQIAVISSIASVAQWTFLSAYSAKVYQHYANPSRGEGSSVLTSAEIAIITDYIKQAGFQMQSAGNWTNNSLEALQNELRTLTQENLLRAADRFQSPSSSQSTKSANGSRAKSSEPPITSAPVVYSSSVPMINPHSKTSEVPTIEMYRATVDYRDPQRSPSSWEAAVKASEEKLIATVKDHGINSLEVLQANALHTFNKFQLLKYLQSPPTKIREAHDAHFNAQIALAKKAGDRSKVIELEFSFHESRATYYMQMESYEEALKYKLLASDSEIEKITLEYELISEDNRSQDVIDAYNENLLEAQYEKASLQVNHYREIGNYPMAVQALESLKTPTIGLVSFRNRAKTSSERDTAVADALIAIQENLINIYMQLEDPRNALLASITRLDHQIEKLHFSKAPPEDITASILGKWEFVYQEAEKLHMHELKHEAKINLDALRPDLSKARGDRIEELTIQMNATREAVLYYTNNEEPIKAHPYFTMYLQYFTQLLGSVEIDNKHLLGFFHSQKELLETHYANLGKAMKDLHNERAREVTGITDMIEWVENQLQVMQSKITKITQIAALQSPPEAPSTRSTPPNISANTGFYSYPASPLVGSGRLGTFPSSSPAPKRFLPFGSPHLLQSTTPSNLLLSPRHFSTPANNMKRLPASSKHPTSSGEPSSSSSSSGVPEQMPPNRLQSPEATSTPPNFSFLAKQQAPKPTTSGGQQPPLTPSTPAGQQTPPTPSTSDDQQPPLSPATESQ